MNLYCMSSGHVIMLDRFYLGGPTSVRGFSMYSMGPQSKGKSIFLWMGQGKWIEEGGRGGEKRQEV